MRTISYPIFLSCRECTNDVYWKKIFENMAFGITPRGVYFKDNTIYSITKKKEFNYSFEDKSPEEIFKDIHEILSVSYGLKSRGDLSKKRELFEEFQRSHAARKAEDVWSKIKKKSLRDNLIQDYVLNCRKLYSLSDSDTRRLYFLISVGCVFKLFNSGDIHLKNGFIENIEGIKLSKGNVELLKKFEEPSSKKESGKIIQLYSLWDNYLKSLA